MNSPLFTLKEKVKILADIADIRVHMDVLNTETGELRDIIKEIKYDLTTKATTNALNIGNLTVTQGKIQNDIEWIKKTYWIVASASIGALVSSIFNIHV